MSHVQKISAYESPCEHIYVICDMWLEVNEFKRLLVFFVAILLV